MNTASTAQPAGRRDAAADAGGPAAAPVVRRVATLAEYHECVAVQREAWGADFNECVPATILQVAQKLGGVVAGAFAADGTADARLLGFVFGMTGVMDGRLVHWSDMLAVRAEARGAHVGERLKRYQRGLARAAGARAMYWTFDPLVARNAHLNLARLGARAVEYVPNMYGDNTNSPLHAGLPTDRLVVEWDLAEPDGAAPNVAADGVLPNEAAAAAGAVVNPVGADGLPALAAAPPDAARVRIAVPPDVEALPPALRAAWRAATRDAFLAYLGRGYAVRAFHRGAGDLPPCYELERAA